MSEGILNQIIKRFELEYTTNILHKGSGVIICKTKDASTMFKIFSMWRKNFNISFNFKPALTNEELAESYIEDSLLSESK